MPSIPFKKDIIQALQNLVDAASQVEATPVTADVAKSNMVGSAVMTYACRTKDMITLQANLAAARDILTALEGVDAYVKKNSP